MKTTQESIRIAYRPTTQKMAVSFPNSEITAFVIRLLKQREKLIRMNVGKTDIQTITNLSELIRIFCFYPNRTHFEWCRWFNQMKTQNLIDSIMPGKSSTCYNKWNEELIKLRAYCGKVIAEELKINLQN